MKKIGLRIYGGETPSNATGKFEVVYENNGSLGLGGDQFDLSDRIIDMLTKLYAKAYIDNEFSDNPNVIVEVLSLDGTTTELIGPRIPVNNTFNMYPMFFAANRRTTVRLIDVEGFMVVDKYIENNSLGSIAQANEEDFETADYIISELYDFEFENATINFNLPQTYEFIDGMTDRDPVSIQLVVREMMGPTRSDLLSPIERIWFFFGVDFLGKGLVETYTTEPDQELVARHLREPLAPEHLRRNLRSHYISFKRNNFSIFKALVLRLIYQRSLDLFIQVWNDPGFVSSIDPRNPSLMYIIQLICMYDKIPIPRNAVPLPATFQIAEWITGEFNYYSSRNLKNERQRLHEALYTIYPILPSLNVRVFSRKLYYFLFSAFTVSEPNILDDILSRIDLDVELDEILTIQHDENNDLIIPFPYVIEGYDPNQAVFARLPPILQNFIQNAEFIENEQPAGRYLSLAACHLDDLGLMMNLVRLKETFSQTAVWMNDRNMPPDKQLRSQNSRRRDVGGLLYNIFMDIQLTDEMASTLIYYDQAFTAFVTKKSIAAGFPVAKNKLVGNTSVFLLANAGHNLLPYAEFLLSRSPDLETVTDEPLEKKSPEFALMTYYHPRLSQTVYDDEDESESSFYNWALRASLPSLLEMDPNQRDLEDVIGELEHNFPDNDVLKRMCIVLDLDRPFFSESIERLNVPYEPAHRYDTNFEIGDIISRYVVGTGFGKSIRENPRYLATLIHRFEEPQKSAFVHLMLRRYLLNPNYTLMSGEPLWMAFPDVIEELNIWYQCCLTEVPRHLQYVFIDMINRRPKLRKLYKEWEPYISNGGVQVNKFAGNNDMHQVVTRACGRLWVPKKVKYLENDQNIVEFEYHHMYGYIVDSFRIRKGPNGVWNISYSNIVGKIGDQRLLSFFPEFHVQYD